MEGCQVTTSPTDGGLWGGGGGMACGKIMRGRQKVGGNGVKDARRILRV